ncbi:unnamed protein product, partial [Diplocarpon coronariae]
VCWDGALPSPLLGSIPVEEQR